MYGSDSNFIITETPVVRALPLPRDLENDYRDFGKEDKAKILMLLVNEHRSIVRADQETLTKMFGLFQQLLEDDGLERVKSHHEWPAAEADMKAYETWMIIEAVHTTNIANVTPGEALYNAISSF